MRIATYNINGVNGRLDILLKWLKKARPDVVCLQELKCTDDKFPLHAISNAGYQAIWHGQKSWNGVAILSRIGEPVKVRRTLPGDPKDLHSRYIEAIINNQFLIASIYLPNGNPWPSEKFDYKLQWFKRLIKHAKALVKHDVPVLLVGDFNVMPDEIDVYNPESWKDNALFRTEVRKAFKSLLATGWKDAIRFLYPDQRIYTFWKYYHSAFAKDLGLRIDHFLVSKHFKNKLIKAGVDKSVRALPGSSDHAPVWLEMDDQ